MIVNLRDKNLPADTVRIDRRTPWGNPFHIGRDGTREEVIEKFRVYLLSHPELVERARPILYGHPKACWCAPLPCHGDVWEGVLGEVLP